MQFKQSNSISSVKVLMPFLVFIIAVFVYSQYGFDRSIVRDNAIYVYSGQRMADGVPPYVSIFDIKGPLAPMLAGLGVIISRQLDWNDIYTVRLIFFIVGCFTVVSVYLLGNRLFESQRAGFFGALTFLGFFHFARHAASGPRAKTPMVLFETLSLLLTSQGRWFWAGLCGSLSFLTWQLTAIYPLVTLILATTQPAKERFHAISRTIAGIGLPLVLVGAYFWYHGALYELLDGTIFFHVLYLDRGKSSFISHFLTPVGAVFRGYGTMFLPILIGLIMVIYIYCWRRSLHQSFRDALTKDAFAPFLLSFPAPVVWSLLDFQAAADFYVFLPYVAIGFSRFLDLAVKHLEGSTDKTAYKVARFFGIGLCIALLALGGINVRFDRASRIDQQKQAAVEIERRFGNDVKILSIGAPEVLVILHRTNPTPYVVILDGIDRRMHDNTPGGFDRWLQELEAYSPDVIVFGPTRGIHIYKLMNWLKSQYHEEQIGPWRLFVRESLDK